MGDIFIPLDLGIDAFKLARKLPLFIFRGSLYLPAPLTQVREPFSELPLSVIVRVVKKLNYIQIWY